jgi:hypothetical protein
MVGMGIAGGSSLITAVSLADLAAWLAANANTATNSVSGTMNLTFLSTGAWQINEDSGTAAGTWGTPNTGTAGSGANFWIRFTRTASSGTGSSSATTGWLQLNANRSVTVITSATHSMQATYTVDIASDAAGTTIVATQAGITMFDTLI